MTDEKTNGTPNEEIETTSLTIPEQEYENVLRQHIRDDPRKAALAKHQIWMNSIPHEYPMPYVPYRIGVYIRYYNQTKYDNYLEKHKQQFVDDIDMCPRWTLVDFYIDFGMTAPRMENSKEWCRLLEDCLCGKVNLIVTQKVSNVSSDPDEITFLSRILAAQKKPVGIYFISEDIFTLASYYMQDFEKCSSEQSVACDTSRASGCVSINTSPRAAHPCGAFLFHGEVQRTFL